jgi:hypothetical protein
MSDVNPVEVEITNPGEGAATGVGLVLGTIGLLTCLALVAFVGVILVIALVPMVLLGAVLWLLRTIVRMDVRHTEWLDEMAFINDK